MKPLIILSIILTLFSCNYKPKNTQTEIDISVDEQQINIEKAKSVFYNMYLPSEMHKVFDMIGAQYNPRILNPVSNVNLYTTNAKAALNLGVFGVDLSYNKMFGENQKMLLYLSVIHKLSLQLGIPDERFAYALRKIHKNLNDKDSLTAYASEIYLNINTYLSNNDRNAIAAMVLAGGWIEAIFIACEIAKDNSDNNEIYDRILIQKYSLKHLITLLSGYKDDPSIAEIIPMFQKLMIKYNKVVVDYKNEKLNMDSMNRIVSTKALNIDIKQADIDSITYKVKEIRSYIIK